MLCQRQDVIDLQFGTKGNPNEPMYLPMPIPCRPLFLHRTRPKEPVYTSQFGVPVDQRLATALLCFWQSQTRGHPEDPIAV